MKYCSQEDYLELLDYHEAAQILKIATGTLRKKVMLGQVPVVKLYGKNGKVLFLKQDLEQFILSHRRGIEN